MGQNLMLNLAAFAVQVCVVVVAAAVLLRVLNIASAGTRYVCWRVVLVVCIAMPLLLQQQRTTPTAVPGEVVVAGNAGPVALTTFDARPDTVVVAPRPADQPVPWEPIAALVIVLGAATRAGWLAIGLYRLRIIRRRSVPIDDADYRDIQQTLGTHARLSSVSGLTQPATFGVWQPVVLLPETLAGQPAALRRAVVTHELFHVQRRDWLWVLVEETLRTVLWFHPAIAWLTSRIQLTREELVDELTVLATGNRKAYIEALLAFAEGGRMRPAPSFARRRHLFTRIVRLSKESVMSSPRVVASAIVIIAVVLVTSWYASSIFPIIAAAPATTRTDGNAPAALLPQERNADVRETHRALAGAARDSRVTRIDPDNAVTGTAELVAAQGSRSGGAPRPGPAPASAAATTKPITPENPIPRRLSSVPVTYPAQLRGSGYRAAVIARVTLDASGRISDVQRLAADVVGDTASVDRTIAATAFFDATADAVRQWRYQSPADPPIAFFVTARFNDEGDVVANQSDAPARPAQFVPITDPARRELALAEERLRTLREQRAAAARSDPQSPEVARLEQQLTELSREVERRARLAEAVGSGQSSGATAGTRVSGPGAIAGTPVRVGGNVRPPAKIRHVAPDYPPIAQSARVQGVVILETVIDEQGRVAEARVLRSIPLLDQAALDAVRQWEFTPTSLNGAPVPVIMTVTVQFTLPSPPAQ